MCHKFRLLAQEASAANPVLKTARFGAAIKLRVHFSSSFITSNQVLPPSRTSRASLACNGAARRQQEASNLTVTLLSGQVKERRPARVGALHARPRREEQVHALRPAVFDRHMERRQASTILAVQVRPHFKEERHAF